MEHPRLAAARHAMPVALALATLMTIGVLLGSTYFGHAHSPYDTCASPGGRTVSCSLLAKGR